MTSGGLRFRGKKYNWIQNPPPAEPAELGRVRTIMGFHMINGKREPIGRMTTSHPALSGNTATPVRKRRTINHNKGATYPGMWVNLTRR